MSNKKAVVKIGSDVEEAKKGLNQISSQLNALEKSVKRSDVAKLATSFNAVTGSVKFAVDAIKKVNAVIKETTDLYKAQATAERQLEVAAKNNPYLNDTSVIQLKSYASELQSISTVGDELLIPMMAQLAAAGRTQAEIQDIMSAALDVSASGMMSLDAAVTALNKTFSGTAGTLGNQVTAIKTLTKEELQSGKAIEIIANQFKGMAKETAELTGTSEQLKNAIGDYKELLGETFEGAFAPMRRWFTEVITKHNDAKKAAREHKKAVKNVYDEEGNIKEDAEESSLFTVWQNLKKETDEARQALIDYKKENGFDYTNQELWDQTTIFESAKVNRLQKETNEAEHAYRKVVEQRLKAEEAARKEAEAQAKIAEQIAEENNRLERREKLRQDYSDSLENVNAQIAARRALGEKISEEEENQLLLNAAMSAYIKMYSDPAFDRSQTKSGMWAGEQEQRDYIQTLAEKAKIAVDIEELKKQSDAILNEATKFITKDSDTKLSDSIKAEIDSLQSYMSEQELTTEQYEVLTQKKIELEKLFTDVVNKENEERTNKEREHIAQLMTDMSQYVDQFANITNGITALVRKNNEQENEEALTELSEQYTSGIISYEEYCEKKKELDKKAAQEEYKIKMWEWQASFLQATANIAQGVAAALTQTPPASYIMAALTAASGAIQIATIMANKPKPPSFATGGIVPGSSYSGDKVQANVNSGEMILNAQQQANLWKLANSGNNSGAVLNMPVTIENNASDKVNASAKMTPEGLQILIQEIVSAQMSAGKYNDSMDIAQSRRNGLEVQ